MKCKCTNNLFLIQIIPCCDECDQNGAYDESISDSYIYDLKIIESNDLERIQVKENGDCAMGAAAGEGCHMYTCSACNHKDNLYLVGGC